MRGGGRGVLHGRRGWERRRRRVVRRHILARPHLDVFPTHRRGRDRGSRLGGILRLPLPRQPRFPLLLRLLLPRLLLGIRGRGRRRRPRLPLPVHNLPLLNLAHARARAHPVHAVPPHAYQIRARLPLHGLPVPQRRLVPRGVHRVPVQPQLRAPPRPPRELGRGELDERLRGGRVDGEVHRGRAVALLRAARGRRRRGGRALRPPLDEGGRAVRLGQLLHHERARRVGDVRRGLGGPGSGFRVRGGSGGGRGERGDRLRGVVERAVLAVRVLVGVHADDEGDGFLRRGGLYHYSRYRRQRGRGYSCGRRESRRALNWSRRRRRRGCDLARRGQRRRRQHRRRRRRGRRGRRRHGRRRELVPEVRAVCHGGHPRRGLGSAVVIAAVVPLITAVVVPLNTTVIVSLISAAAVVSLRMRVRILRGAAAHRTHRARDKTCYSAAAQTAAAAAGAWPCPFPFPSLVGRDCTPAAELPTN
ncbi:hypothetical protein B0H14DRAFT_1289917 [Mycena olivaceomarginata]|nr:hypothetical protein B0H14DRAFT_1289917 [Mycena olivaceomarginata]